MIYVIQILAGTCELWTALDSGDVVPGSTHGRTGWSAAPYEVVVR